MNDAKRALRQWVLDHPAYGDSGRLCETILSHPWFQTADTVMAYMAMPSEPDLGPVLLDVLRQGKRLALPRCEDGSRMTARWVTDLAGLIPGPFGILEPGADLPLLPASEIGLILTPGMAFDRAGRRLGRGKGYYDRFLSDFSGRTIGICFRPHLVERVPSENHDRAVDAVATEDAVILCGTEGDAT